MRLYALTELHDPEAIELFITEEDAKRALDPAWWTPLEEDESELEPGSFSLDGRADPLELVVLALNQTGASGVGAVVIKEPRETRGTRHLGAWSWSAVASPSDT